MFIVWVIRREMGYTNPTWLMLVHFAPRWLIYFDAVDVKSRAEQKPSLYGSITHFPAGLECWTSRSTRYCCLLVAIGNKDMMVVVASSDQPVDLSILCLSRRSQSYLPVYK